MPKVSIIVPVYNVGKYLDRCLDSLAHQTLQDIEVLVINDSSPDESQVIIDKYAKTYPDIIKPYLKPNGGVSSVRNFGIDHATGEYIGFVDGDDYVEYDMYEKMYNTASQNKANVVICDFFFTYPDNNEKLYQEYEYKDTKEMLTRLFAVLWNKIYKHSYLDKINFRFIEGYRYEDVSYLVRMAAYYDNYYFLREPLVHYMQRKNSSMASHNYKVKEIVYILQDMLAFYKERGFYEQYKNEIEYLFIKYCLGQPFRSCSKIADKADRSQSLHMLWSNLNDNFPNWHKNPYLRELPGLKHTYFRLINNSTFWISAGLNRYI